MLATLVCINFESSICLSTLSNFCGASCLGGEVGGVSEGGALDGDNCDVLDTSDSRDGFLLTKDDAARDGEG